MRAYETIVVLDSQLEDEPIEEQILNIEQLITSNKGEMVGTERWGRRKLSYEMGDRQQGFYTLFRYNASQTIPIEMDRLFKVNDHVLRHLTIRVKKHTEVSPQVNEDDEEEDS